MAIIIVTTDKADAIGVIKIASPIVNPKLTIAIAPASIIPINESVDLLGFWFEIKKFEKNNHRHIFDIPRIIFFQ